MSAFIPEELVAMLRATAELQRSYLVGGGVRDWLLGIPNKDFDIEVFGVSYEQLAAGLAQWGRTDLVGRSFGVVKLTTGGGRTYDFSIPRRDSKVAPGHKGFEISFDPSITLEEAAARRDFTINALMFDPRRGEVLDFFGGRADLERRVLRHTSAAFSEDPLRVLRGMQFIARFGLAPAPETVELCRRIMADQLPDWQAADAESRIVYTLAVLAHDFAKPQTTQAGLKDGQPRIVSPGHQEAGGPLTEQFLNRINAPAGVRERVIPLVTHHLAHLQRVTDRSVRRLAKRLEPATIRELVLIITADQYGRPPRPQLVSERVRELQARAEELQVQSSAPKPILMGRHLIELGLEPGTDLGTILEAAYEAQLEGKFYDLPHALQWLAAEETLPLPEAVRARL